MAGSRRRQPEPNPTPTMMRMWIPWLVALPLWGADPQGLPEAELRSLVAKDDVPAMVELAFRIHDGEVMPFDVLFVVEAFKRGSEADITRAHVGLALCHRSGLVTPPDPAAVPVLLRKAADRKDPRGTYELGRCYLQGSLLPRDEREGVELIREAGRLGLETADVMLAALALTGDGVERNTEQALQQLRHHAVEKGSAFAATCLGFWHLGKYDDQMKRDPKLAKKYLLMAAEKNHAGAFVALGDMAMNNGGWNGNKAARQEGAKWYRLGVARYSAEAMRKLGSMQMRDTLVRKEGEDWYQLLLDADRLGDGVAADKLSEIHYHAPGYYFRDLDWKKSAFFGEKALASGDLEWNQAYMTVERLLKLYYEGGMGLERDFGKCLEIAQPHFENNKWAAAYAGRILLHPDAPMGRSREHFIRGYACLLKSRELHRIYKHTIYPFSDEAMFVFRSRHGMTREEIARAEELFRQGFPNPKTPLLP